MIDNPQRRVMPKEYSEKFDNVFDRWMNQGTGDCLDFHYTLVELNQFMREIEQRQRHND